MKCTRVNGKRKELRLYVIKYKLFVLFDIVLSVVLETKTGRRLLVVYVDKRCPLMINGNIIKVFNIFNE